MLSHSVRKNKIKKLSRSKKMIYVEYNEKNMYLTLEKREKNDG